MVGVSVADTTLGTLVANLGYDKLTFPAPVFVGDTLRSESECLDVRTSKSRPNAGIVTWEHRSFNQRGELVCKCARSAAHLQEAGVISGAPPPRSWLFVPADSNKKILKALESEADAVIFDLEDSVAPSCKPLAREILGLLPGRIEGSRNAGYGSTRSAARRISTISMRSTISTSTASSCPRPKPATTSPTLPPRSLRGACRSMPSSPKPRRPCSPCSVIATAAPAWRR
jgi:hypothetical protein